MKRHLTIALATLLTTTAAARQPDYGQAATVRIWDNATAPHSNGITAPEEEQEPYRIARTSEAELYLFPAEASKVTGQGVVICPGGGYVRLAMDHEGFLMARWFASQGITAAVLKYRMPNHHPEVPLEDAEQALRLLRGDVPGLPRELLPQPDRVGIVGCSAGGHLAAMASTLGAVRPAFAILFYPVITAAPGEAHEGSFDNLLGERTPERDAAYSLERCVTPATPPTLLLLSDDDRSVPPTNATRYYEALKRHGIPASLHIYPSGGHGWGIRDTFRYREQWQQAVTDWLAVQLQAATGE